MEQKQGFYYGWFITASATLTLMISNGMILSGLSVFDPVLLGEFHWTKGAYKLKDTISFLVAGFGGPAIGYLMDRYGIRPLMIAGALLSSIGYFCYQYISAIQHTYFIHLLLGL